jgi:hypothetical protein
MTRIAIVLCTSLAGLALTGCTPAQTDQANRAVAVGQLFCSVASGSGPIVVALADASGVPVTVTGKAASTVAAACGVIGGIPVIPPPAPAAAPVVAAKVDV